MRKKTRWELAAALEGQGCRGTLHGPAERQPGDLHTKLGCPKIWRAKADHQLPGKTYLQI